MIEFLIQLTAGLPLWLGHALIAVIAVAAGMVIGLVVHAGLFRALRRIAGASGSETDNIVVRRLARPTRYAFAVQGAVLAVRQTPVLPGVWEDIGGFVMPALIGWIAVSLLRALVDIMGLRAEAAGYDNLSLRRRRTRLQILSRLATFLIVFLTIALMLFSIPGVRQIGATLMASAGLAALAVGAAAQPALKALIAGFQMALTEPITIGDVIVVDGETGSVEDIRTTYVVIRLWDERRLIVPTTRFLEGSFQNWTRRKADRMTAVMLYLHPFARIPPIRAEFARQLAATGLWDGNSHAVQVNNSTHEWIEVRLLMSARDGANAAALQPAIRENMLAWLRDNQPDAIVNPRKVPEGDGAAGGNKPPA